MLTYSTKASIISQIWDEVAAGYDKVCMRINLVGLSQVWSLQHNVSSDVVRPRAGKSISRKEGLSVEEPKICEIIIHN